jgi:hypothetical protein
MTTFTTIETMKTPFGMFEIEVLTARAEGPARITLNGQPAQISFADSVSAHAVLAKQASYAPAGTNPQIEIVPAFSQRTQMRDTRNMSHYRPAEIWFRNASTAREYLLLHLIEATRSMVSNIRTIAFDTLERQAA